ncbi:uncharacterized protein LOC114301104 [Camellia sinensis]|uniref:uncharacterized protein LOC114301104 n=1 Tax=Camellia sinensis TaxID=4442 RepID=UPI001036D56F|nr:uncharacterized protein LOC114301104 [Camellia sinensis]
MSYHVVWLGVEKANAIIYGDHLLSFDQLQWYSDAMMRYNPGSYVYIDYDTRSQQFCHFFVSFATCISGYNSCRPLLFLGGTFLKRKYKGQLLVATAKDGNNGLFHVTFVIVDSETTANWSWFLHKLGKVVDGKRQITFISNCNLGLLEAMPKVFPSTHHGYCLQHLKSNLRYRMKRIDNGFRDHLVSSLGDCAYEPTVVGFHKKLEKLKEEGKQRAFNFFKDLAPEHWANSYFRMVAGMRYAEITSNAAKSFNNWIKEARNLPITQMVDTIRTQLMRQMSARRDQENKWNELICPTFKTMLLDLFNNSRSWQVSKPMRMCLKFIRYHLLQLILQGVRVLASTETYRAAYWGAIFPIPSVEKPPFDPTDFTIYPPTVKRSPGRPKKNRIPSRVDIARRTCSCFKWQINEFPCDHVVIAIQKSRYNLNDCMEHYFHVETYRAAYWGVIFPIPSVEKPPFDPTDFAIYPPTVKRSPGRPKKNRIPSRGEKLKQIRCGRCDKFGSHNKKSCNEPI